MMYATVALALFALCGYTEASSLRIIGGEKANPADYPFFARVKTYYPGLGIGSCGGTIINGKYVLTAWHCVAVDGQNHPEYGIVPAEQVTVKYFDPMSGGYNAQLRVTDIKLFGPPLSQSKTESDIAILELESAPTIPAQPSVTLPNPQSPPQNGLTGVAIGMGRVHPLGQASDYLKQLDMILVERESRTTFILKADIDLQGNTCEGDSGGPWLVKNMDGSYAVYGVVSRGAILCSPVGAAFTDVSQYVDWIEKETAM